MLVYIIISALIFLLIPENAFAWGPGTHIEITFSLLEKLGMIAPAIRTIIAGREEWFVYGSVAADIVVGKKFAGEHDHCHNWRVGQLVLKAAKTDRERAAAYGYLSHLAADVVAHNYYIPYKIIKNYRARLLSHTYWEMCFDMHVRQGVWEKMTRMITGDFSPFDHLLENVLKRALFSFKTSKTIFSSILALQRFKQFRRTFAVYARKSKFKLDTDDITHYMRLALQSSFELLVNPKNAQCLKGDPTGAYKIEYANMLRWRIKNALSHKIINSRDVDQLLILTKQALYKNMFVPEAVLPNLKDICSYSSQRR